MQDVKRVESAVVDLGREGKLPTSDDHVLSDENTPLLHRSTGKPTPGTDENNQDYETSGDSADEISQNAINLLTVATPKLASFASLSFMVLTGSIGTILSVVFLVFLIGAWATLAGLLVMVIMQPLNKIIQARYSAAEDALMDAREKKTHVVTEALHGIKMIKISAIETQWQELIMAARAGEIRALQRSIIWDFALHLSWMCLPIVFSTISLGVYAYLNGGLNASAAFTALAVFSSLEGALMGIPMFTTMMIDALVGSKRIQDHLDGRNQADYRLAGDAVKFQNVTISWPTDQQDSKETFLLRNINLDFPNDSLR